MAAKRYLVRTVPSRQTFLGRSQQGTLIIIKPPPPPATEEFPLSGPVGRNILRLPDEILAAILEDAGSCVPTTDDEWDRETGPADWRRNAVAISIVCRRFNRIITPVLYRELYIGFKSCHTVRVRGFKVSYLRDASNRQLRPLAVEHLHRTLQENSKLAKLCRSLVICVQPCPCGPRTCLQYLMCRDFTGWLADTPYFELRILTKAADPALSLGVTRDCARMVTGISVTCYNFTSDSYLSQAWEFSKDPRLSKILNFGWPEHATPTSRVPSALHFNIPHSLFITSLTIHFYQGSPGPEDLRKLLLITHALQDFELSLPWDDHTGTWSLATVFSVLAPHARSLKSATIGQLYTSLASLSGMDLVRFGNLELLSLTRRTTGIDRTEGIDAILAAPRLRSFIWDLASDDQQVSVFLNDFRPDGEEEFIRQLAETAIARNHPLQRIHILFQPDEGFFYDEAVRPAEYPWDRMDRLATHLKGLTTASNVIHLTYCPPTISREVYDNPPWIEWRREGGGGAGRWGRAALPSVSVSSTGTLCSAGAKEHLCYFTRRREWEVAEDDLWISRLGT